MDGPSNNAAGLAVLRQAARTLAALPSDPFTKPVTPRSHWPEMIRGAYIIVDGTRKNTGFRPTALQIDEMNHVLDCLAELPPDSRRLLWARACGIRWRKLESMTGRSRSSLHRDLQMALRQFQKIWSEPKNHLDK